MEDPFLKFKRWQDKIRRSRGHDRAEAACLSTVDPDGWPEGRMVLVRSSGPEGFTFYTNHGSHKAKSLAATPRASLTYYWEDLGRQVRVQGSVQRVSEEESMAYFATRSRLSQIGAWASDQSQELKDRGTLLKRVAQMTLKFWRGSIPKPPNWGGYRIVPHSVEFWINRAHRLHDRILYQRSADGEWGIRRLYP